MGTVRTSWKDLSRSNLHSGHGIHLRNPKSGRDKIIFGTSVKEPLNDNKLSSTYSRLMKKLHGIVQSGNINKPSTAYYCSGPGCIQEMKGNEEKKR